MSRVKTDPESPSGSDAPACDDLKLRLYVAGQSPKSLAAIANLRRICQKHFPGRNCFEIIDLIINPELARGDQIVAIPTLVKRFPGPIRKVIGDLSNVDRVLTGLDLSVV
jgi:circadian clock protein KaiB